MNMTNLKTRVEIQMEDLLAKYQNCEIPTNVSNQFDEDILEEALSNMDQFDTLVQGLAPAAAENITTMGWAHMLAVSFDAPEISRAWTD